MIQEGENAVGSNDLRPAAAKPEIIAPRRSDPHFRESAIQRVGDARRQRIGVAVKAVVGDVLRVVVGFEELVIVGVANPGFIHPSGARSPGPVARAGLRAGVFNAQPWRGNLGSRGIDCEVVALADKIHALE